jgi:hypothetical protein
MKRWLKPDNFSISQQQLKWDEEGKEQKKVTHSLPKEPTSDT